MGVKNRKKMGKTEQEVEGERGRKVRGAFPPQGGQKTQPIMERPFQKQRLQDALSFHRFQCSLERERDRGRETGRRA